MATGSRELDVLQQFPGLEMRGDPHNHSVPVVDSFKNPEGDPIVIFIVTPFLRPSRLPDFENGGDMLDYSIQVLEGILFYHAYGISRVLPKPSRDLHSDPVMLEAKNSLLFYPISLYRLYGTVEMQAEQFPSRA